MKLSPDVLAINYIILRVTRISQTMFPQNTSINLYLLPV